MVNATDTSYQLQLVGTGGSGLTGQAGSTTPYLNLIPGSDGDTTTCPPRIETGPRRDVHHPHIDTPQRCHRR